MPRMMLGLLLFLAAAAVNVPQAPSAKPASFDLKDDLVDFHFGWSAETAAVPELTRRLTADKDRALAKLKSRAAEERRERNREKHGLTFNGFQSSTQYDTAGRSPRLLSLSIAHSAYTGGAHGNYGTSALLWDRKAKREINLIDLFVSPSSRDRLLTGPWCYALNEEREEKLGEFPAGTMSEKCPGLDEIAIVPTDTDRNGRFDQLALTASPYVAGSYAEGSYEVMVDVTADFVAAMKADYRGSFEVPQRQ
jgi:hypothetical protein